VPTSSTWFLVLLPWSHRSACISFFTINVYHKENKWFSWL